MRVGGDVWPGAARGAGQTGARLGGAAQGRSTALGRELGRSKALGGMRAELSGAEPSGEGEVDWGGAAGEGGTEGTRGRD